jgi:hypothetical protein
MQYANFEEWACHVEYCERDLIRYLRKAKKEDDEKSSEIT